MPKPSKPAASRERSAAASSPLSSAAIALDGELRRYFELSETARKMPLNSEKNLERAARAMTEAAESQDRVAAHVHALVGAIAVAREAQESSAAALAARAREMAGRATELGELLAQFASLGDEAKALNAMMQEAAGYKRDPYPGDDADAQARLDAVRARMDEVATRAEDLATLADRKDLPDIGRQADSLRQQIQSARNKLGLLQRSLGRG